MANPAAILLDESDNLSILCFTYLKERRHPIEGQNISLRIWCGLRGLRRLNIG